MSKYVVKHRVALAYYPQNNGQAEVSNQEKRRISKKTVDTTHKDRANKLDDALWTYHMAYKTPIGISRYQLVYGKACQLPIELEHKAHWVLRVD